MVEAACVVSQIAPGFLPQLAAGGSGPVRAIRESHDERSHAWPIFATVYGHAGLDFYSDRGGLWRDVAGPSVSCSTGIHVGRHVPETYLGCQEKNLDRVWYRVRCLVCWLPAAYVRKTHGTACSGSLKWTLGPVRPDDGAQQARNARRRRDKGGNLQVGRIESDNRKRPNPDFRPWRLLISRQMHSDPRRFSAR